MPLDYDLLMRRGTKIEGVDGPIRKMDRTPTYRSKLPVETSYVSRFDPIFDMSLSESADLEFEQCSARMLWVGSLSDGSVGPLTKNWRSFMSGYTPDTYSELSLCAMAALSQFHILTTAQVASFAGVSFDEAHKALTRLYGCGVLLRADGDIIDHDEAINKLGHVWRIATGRGTGPFVERWTRNLTDFEYMMVTSGRDISRGVVGSAGMYSNRHNIQMAEVALRFQEISTSVTGVLGEQSGVISNFVDTSRHYIRGNVSDASVVTSSGRIILFELTTAKLATENISQKAMAWAFAIATSDIDFAVVFANTNPKHDRELFRYRVLRGILDAEDKLVNPGPSLIKAQSRIFVSDVTNHWCPSSHVITKAMATLDVLNPATLDYYRLAPEGIKMASTPSVISSRAALSTPAWITDDIKDL